ncbi:MAG: DNA repair protein RecO [Xanthomonadales bacterium]|jgi:DNA repair protein RecO (recombination protein O)|nr:DNA repair protein RecO [Xanthomonadales bacterium]
MQKVQLQPAYVLHSRPFRESSQLLELLTRDFGRVGAVARGARGARSRWRGVLQPFRPLLVSFSRRSELATLTAADQVAAPPALSGEALYCGLYVNELTLRLLLRDDPHAEVFEQYRETLGALVGGEALQSALRLYEKQLLDATGFGLILDREAGSETPLDPQARYDYQPDRGPVRVADSARARDGVLAGHVLLALDAGHVDPADWSSLRALMRRVLKRQLGDRPLASEALFRALRRGRAEPAPDATTDPGRDPVTNKESNHGSSQ